MVDIMKYHSPLVCCYFSLLPCTVLLAGHFTPKYLAQISSQSEEPGLCGWLFATQTVELLQVSSPNNQIGMEGEREKEAGHRKNKQEGGRMRDFPSDF